jgi:hypothetical protein
MSVIYCLLFGMLKLNDPNDITFVDLVCTDFSSVKELSSEINALDFNSTPKSSRFHTFFCLKLIL